MRFMKIFCFLTAITCFFSFPTHGADSFFEEITNGPESKSNFFARFRTGCFSDDFIKTHNEFLKNILSPEDLNFETMTDDCLYFVSHVYLDLANLRNHLEKKAEEGNVTAQTCLGVLLCKSAETLEAGETWYRLAANNGNGAAYYGLLHLYSQTPPRLDTIDLQNFLLDCALEAGYIPAFYQKAMRFYASNNRQEALSYLTKAADAGFSPAQTALATLILEEEGYTTQTLEKALVLLKKAQVSLSTPSQIIDQLEKLLCFSLSGELKDLLDTVPPQTSIPASKMLLKWLGQVPIESILAGSDDLYQIYKCYQRATNNVHISTSAWRVVWQNERTMSRLLAPLVTKIRHQTILPVQLIPTGEGLEKRANAGDTHAQYLYGLFHLMGLFKENNLGIAHRYLKLAEKIDDTIAKKALSALYLQFENLPKALERGRFYKDVAPKEEPFVPVQSAPAENKDLSDDIYLETIVKAQETLEKQSSSNEQKLLSARKLLPYCLKGGNEEACKTLKALWEKIDPEKRGDLGIKVGDMDSLSTKAGSLLREGKAGESIPYVLKMLSKVAAFPSADTVFSPNLRRWMITQAPTAPLDRFFPTIEPSTDFMRTLIAGLAQLYLLENDFSTAQILAESLLGRD